MDASEPHREPDIIKSMTSSLSKQLIEQQEAYLKSFFGDIDTALVFAKYVVLEEYPMKINTIQDKTGDTIRLSFRQVWVLRHKTDEEMHAEEAERLAAGFLPPNIGDPVMDTLTGQIKPFKGVHFPKE